MGLYVKALKRSIQLSRSTVGEIHSLCEQCEKRGLVTEHCQTMSQQAMG